MFPLLPLRWLLGATLLWFCSLLCFSVSVWWLCRLRDDRIHWFEIHEQDFCPDFIKSVVRRYLASCWDSFGLSSCLGSVANTAAFEIAAAVESGGHSAVRVLDMCSGGGGPVPIIHSSLRRQMRDVRTVLTDLFPDTARWEALSAEHSGLLYCGEAVDATDVAANKLLPTIGTDIGSDTNLLTLRTFFASFHHFKPEQTVSLLSDAIQNGHALVVVELFIRRKNLSDFINSIFFGVIFPLPFAILFIWKSFWASKRDSIALKVLKCAGALVTMPLTLSVLLHDCVVSCGRCYSLAQLQQLPSIARAHALKHKSADELRAYEWKAYEKVPQMLGAHSLGGALTFLVGIPELN